MTKTEIGFTCGSIGFLLGVIVGSFLNDETNRINNVRIFQREEKPSVIKIDYRDRSDGILVEDRTTSSGKYISFKDYLANIPIEYDRRLEELNINKTLGVYDEKK